MQYLSFSLLALASLAAAGTKVSNPETSLLTQTNKHGVVTGQPAQPTVDTSIPSQPPAETNVGTAASIPPGLPKGINTVPIGTDQTLIVSVASKTTEVISDITSAPENTAHPSPRPSVVTTKGGSNSGNSGNSGKPSQGSGSGSQTGKGSDNSTKSGSGKGSETTPNAASNLNVAGGAMLGAAGLVAAFL